MSREKNRQKNKDSQALVFKWLSDFDPESVRGKVLDENIEYLQKTIDRLESLMVKSGSDSKTASTARARAIARDTQKSTEGLINGIAFAVSFLTLGGKDDFNEDSNIERQEVQ